MRLLLIMAVSITTALSAQDSVVVRGSEGARLDSLLQAAAADGFSGLALVSRGGETVLLKGYGLANRAIGIPFGPRTVVQIGSNVKDFTKTIVLQLAAEGRLTLDDSLGRFFPEAPADKRGITLRQLLNHRAGFPQRIGPDSEVIGQGPYLARAFAQPLAFRPGSGEQYSNTGYSILAAIIQQLTRQSFDEAVNARVFQPAGMRETGYLLAHFDPRRLAHGYREGQDRGTMLDMPHAADGLWWNLRGNGGMLSTAGDMLRFYRALSGIALLASPAARAQVLSPDGADVLAGSDLTCFFMFGSFPRENVQIVLASNVAESPAPRVLRSMIRVLGLEPDGDQNASQGPSLSALPATGPGATVTAYLAAFNTGDTTVMQRFFAEHAASGPGTPPMATRLSRYRTMFGDLGRLTVIRVRQRDDGFDVEVTSAQGDSATFTFVIADVEPFLMQGLRVER